MGKNALHGPLQALGRATKRLAGRGPAMKHRVGRVFPKHLLTGAVAQDPESSYGGVERWFVPPALRGNPEELRCQYCGGVGCSGERCYEWGSYDGEDD